MYKTTIKSDGMKCENCEKHMNEALSGVIEAKKITSLHKKGESVIISDTEPDEESIKKAIATTNYEYVGMRTEPYKKRLFG